MQAGGDEGEVCGSHHDLQGGDAGMRQREAPASDLQLAAHEGGERKIDHPEQQAGKTEGQRRTRPDSCHLARSAGKGKQADAGERDEPEPHGHPAEDDQLCDLLRFKAPAGIEAVAHRAAAQRGHADIVADREAGEGGECGARIGQRLADIAQRQDVEECQAGVGTGREGEREREVYRRDGGDGAPDVLPCILAQRPVDEPTGEEHGAGDQRVEDMASFHAFSLA